MNDAVVDYISTINSPEDLKKLNIKQMELYCEQIRKFLINSVSKTGGHLASNLGVVELTVALHKVFNSPEDKLIWDVGHQSYVHKIITGRASDFSLLRKENGLSGFTRHSESEHDAFVSGHSSTSLSIALGIAEAMRLKNKTSHVVAVVGDGAFTGGMIYEALNNINDLSNLIVILNHNAMSISKNVGSLARYLAGIRSKPSYLKLKSNVDGALDRIPVVGKKLKASIRNGKSLIRKALYHSTLFEDYGFVYLGPVDGHDISELMHILNRAKNEEKPVLIFVDTIKGKGYSYAELNPGAYHGIPPFDIETGNPDIAAKDSFSNVAGKYICKLAENDERICAITAAMKYGTGLQYFSSKFKSRFFDVGIAEEHAVTFAAGLASQGMIPVFCVYSTFLQRSFDQILHDCSIDQKQHVVLLVDRAGVVGDDGETHQGIFDAAMLNLIPGITVFSPADYMELKNDIYKAVYETQGVVAVRYPRGRCSAINGDKVFSDYKFVEYSNSDILIVTYGRLYFEACKAAEELFDKYKVRVSILKLNKIIPINNNCCEISLKYKKIYFFEEGIRSGGIGEHFRCMIDEKGYSGKYYNTAIDDFVPQSSVDAALNKLGLNSESMVKLIIKGD